jgi:hypothetical protein
MQNVGLVEIAGAVVVILYIVWLIAFFQFVRPRLMARAGKQMNVRVKESLDPLDAGTYNTAGNASVQKSAAVQFLDIFVLLIGTVGVCALISIPAFFFGESGAPYRWESIILGTQADIVNLDITPLRNDRATVSATLENQGSANLLQCQVRSTDYSARNGYMNGSSAFFDLARGETRTIEFPLDAINPARGEYTVNFALECQNRIKDKIPAHVQVTE